MTLLPPKKRYNLRDVARRAGVSVATVSRAMNTPARVSPDTLERVQTAMTDLRFVPSAAARAINSGRSRVVAALLPTLDNSTYARVVDGLENRLTDFGLSLTVAQTHGDGVAEEERAKQLIEIGAEGLILAGITHSADLLRLVEHIQIPTITTSYYDAAYHLPTVGYDNREAVHLAARHLEALGHRNIAVVHAPLGTNDRFDQRRTALLSEPFDAEFTFFAVDTSVEGGVHAAQSILHSENQPTSVICFSDALALGVMSELQRQGTSIPADISVMGIEDLPSSQFLYPSLTSVRLQVQDMGERAAEAIAGWLETDKRPDHLKLPVELIHRASTAIARSE